MKAYDTEIFQRLDTSEAEEGMSLEKLKANLINLKSKLQKMDELIENLKADLYQKPCGGG